jgi:penicillin-binding protein 1A
MADQKFSSEKMKRYFSDPEYRKSALRSRSKLSRRQWLILLVVVISFAGFATWYGVFIIAGLPPLEKLENPKPDLATKIFSVDGDVIDQLSYKNRTHVALEKLPSGLVGGLVATEDKQFYNHWGIHLTRIAKAMVKNIIALDLDREGASTLTQQLSRNLYSLSQDKSIFQKITRKFRELFTSIQIERNFTKREILELYLNVAYFGRTAYGIEAAAQVYFGKYAADLKPSEYTLLIGMLKGPGYYDPVSHYERALKRRDIVIGQMVKDKILSADSAEILRADSLSFKAADLDFRTGIAPHFVEWVRQQLSRKAEKMGVDIYRDGLRVFTTIDSRMQRHAIRAVEEHMALFQPVFDSIWDWRKAPEALELNIEKAIRESEPYRHVRNAEQRDSLMNALRGSRTFVDSVRKVAQTVEVGFVVLDPHTGQIKAMVGGRNFRQFKYGLNHVTQIRRQPGSAFKPFVYTVAIDNGYPACFEIQNQPVTIPMPDGTRWTPENYDHSVGGKFTLREGVKQSINLVTIRAILEIAPPDQVSSYARRMGINTNIPPYASIALGSVEVTPLELTSSYGVFANEGILVAPISILRIEDKDGNLIEENAPERREALSKETAYLMTNLLQGTVEPGGTARRAIRSFYNGAAAGKTGTTNDYGDAWFVGFTPQLVAGAWVGFDDNRIKFNSSEGQGGRAAAPIWGRFMQYVYEDPDLKMETEYFHQPDGIITDTICVDTKKKAREFCPMKTTEIFNSKYPLGLCEKHTSANWNEEEKERKKSKITW